MAQAIRLLPGKMALVRYPRGTSKLAPGNGDAFFAFLRTEEEDSYVLEAERVPRDAPKKSTGWRLLQIEGPFPLDVIGVLASVTKPLAEAKVSIFALATYDTDYFLVQGRQLKTAIAALRKAGHRVDESG
jgi:uncharacterized protein